MEVTHRVRPGATAAQLAWRVVHLLVVGALLAEALYCAFQVMVVLQPPDVTGPLFGRASEVSLDLLVRRRLYAIEGWLAAVGLAIYVGVTEIRPRLR